MSDDRDRILSIGAPGVEGSTAPAAMVAVPLIIHGDSMDQVEDRAVAALAAIEAIADHVAGVQFPAASNALAYVACWLQTQAIEALLELQGVDTAGLRSQMIQTMTGPPPGPQVKVDGDGP